MARAIRLLLPLLCALAAPIAGCSGEGGTSGGARPPILRFALHTEPDSFDPGHASLNGANAILQRQVLEGLMEYDYAAEDPTQLQPLLAESVASADGRVWRIQLREGARFHDPWEPPLWPGRSRAVTARDVLYSWLRLADESQGAADWWALEGLIAGLDEFHDELRAASDAAERERIWSAALETGGVEGIELTSERSLEIELARPEPVFLAILASPYTAIVPHEAVQRRTVDFRTHPVGSGPFVLESWKPNPTAVFRRTPSWRGQPDPAGPGVLPHADEVRFSFVAEADTRELLFRNGQIDRYPVTPTNLGALIENDRPVAELAERGVRVERAVMPNVAFLGFSMRDPVVGHVPGDDRGNARRRKLREAIALSFPYSRWERLVRSESGAVPTASFLPPQLPEADGAPEWDCRREDLERARELLAEAGWTAEDPPRLRFEMNATSSADDDVAALFVDALAKAGIECEAVKNTWPAFLDKAKAGEAQIYLYGWTLDWPDPANLLQLFYGGSASSGLNFSCYADPEFDRLYEAYRATADPGERRALAHDMLRCMVRDLPAVPIDFRTDYMLVHPWLAGHRLHPFDAYACKYFRIEES